MQALGPLNRARAGLGKKADAKRGVEESIALGKQFGELGMALQGAAGVAMHLGAGEQALDAGRAGHRAQPRRPARSRTRRTCCWRWPSASSATSTRRWRRSSGSTSTTSRSGSAARALVRAVAGDIDRRAGRRRGRRARRAAPATSTSPSAGWPACWRAGRAGDEARRRRWLEQLGTLASSVGDVVFIAIAQLLARRPAATADAEAAAAGARLAPHRRLRRRRLTPAADPSLRRPAHPRIWCADAAVVRLPAARPVVSVAVLRR